MLQPIGFVTDRWRAVRPMFDAGEVGSEWIWDDTASTYVCLSAEG